MHSQLRNSVLRKEQYQASLTRSPFRLLLMMALSIFLVEALIITTIHSVLVLPTYIKSLLGALVLVVLLSPMLFYFLFFPLLTHIRMRRRAEEALQIERDKLKGILDTMEDGVYIVNGQHDIEYVNPALEQSFGPVNGRKCYVYIHERKEPCLRCENEENFARKNLKQEWYSPKARKHYDLFNTPIRNSDGRLSKLEIFHDITERKKAEEALRASEEQLLSLSSHLMAAQEIERKKIALELHDDLGQSLTLLKLRLRFIQNNLHDEQIHLKAECNDNLQFIDQIIENIRRLSRDLSPSILEDLGLTAALKRMIVDTSKYYSMDVSVELPNIDQFFPRKDQIFIYRIFQEALTNIGKHSLARRVYHTVRIQDDEKVFFAIEDDGKGFDMHQVMEMNSDNRGTGIAAMRQRVRTLGGSFTIRSQKEKGTKIVFTIPTVKRGDNDDLL